MGLGCPFWSGAVSLNSERHVLERLGSRLFAQSVVTVVCQNRLTAGELTSPVVFEHLRGCIVERDRLAASALLGYHVRARLYRGRKDLGKLAGKPLLLVEHLGRERRIEFNNLRERRKAFDRRSVRELHHEGKLAATSRTVWSVAIWTAWICLTLSSV